MKIAYKVGETAYERTLDYEVVDVPQEDTLGAAFASDFGNTQNVVYTGTTNEGFIILASGDVTVDEKVFTCGTVSDSNITTDTDHIVATYDEGTLTVGYYAKDDVNEGALQSEVTVANAIVSKEYTVEVVKEASAAPDAASVSLAAKTESTVVSQAEISVPYPLPRC